MSTLFFETELE